MSERLTHSYQCGGYWASILKVSSCGEGECKGEIIDKLAHYEDINPNPKEILATIESMSAKLMRYQRLAEQGRLLELPCKVGDMVFSLWSRVDSKKQHIRRTTITRANLFHYLNRIQNSKSFVTRAEAQAALQEERNEN